MVRRLIEQDIICDAVPTEFEVLDRRFYPLKSEFMAKQLPVVLFGGGLNVRFV
jgi:hypothetical protein